VGSPDKGEEVRRKGRRRARSEAYTIGDETGADCVQLHGEALGAAFLMLGSLHWSVEI
jgi:hypothetical protein